MTPKVSRVDSERFRELIAPLALLRCAAVVRFRLWVATALALSGIIGTLVHAQLTDEEKEKRAPRPKPQRRSHGRLPCLRQRLHPRLSLRAPFQRAGRLRL